MELLSMFKADSSPGPALGIDPKIAKTINMMVKIGLLILRVPNKFITPLVFVKVVLLCESK